MGIEPRGLGAIDIFRPIIEKHYVFGSERQAFRSGVKCGAVRFSLSQFERQDFGLEVMVDPQFAAQGLPM